MSVVFSLLCIIINRPSRNMFGVFRYDLDVVCCIERIQTSVSLCNCNCSEFCPHLGFSKVSMSRQADCILIVPLELFSRCSHIPCGVLKVTHLDCSTKHLWVRRHQVDLCRPG